MQDFAHKLIRLTEQQSDVSVPTAIFGTASTLSQSLDTRQRVRIGLWPCVSQDHPELAMGLFTVLAFLLERWQDIRVYRLFANIEGDPADYSWTIQNSQFDLDDWQLEALDENVALWGKLEQIGSTWTLTLEIENDLDDDEQPAFSYEAASVPALVNLLPKVAADIAVMTDSNHTRFDPYPETAANEDTLRALLAALFHWQVKLHLALWGIPWEIDTIEADLEKLTTTAQATQDAFGAWCASNALAHAILPGYATIAEAIVPAADALRQQFPGDPSPVLHTAYALHLWGQTPRAYDILETGIDQFTENIPMRLLLAELYRYGGRVLDVIGTFQDAIEEKVVNADVYRRYAQFMALIRDYHDEYVLIDPDEYDIEDAPVWEAIEAYEESLKIDPKQVALLQEQLLLFIDVIDHQSRDRLWEGFARLVNLDKDGHAVRSVVDALDGLDDIAPAIATLEKTANTAPDRADLYVSLAAAYLLDEDTDRAAAQLDKAAELTDDPFLLNDIDRLSLTVADPDFEMHLGEIIGLVGSGAKLKSDDMAFLEDTIENAPAMAEAYALLAKAHILREAPEEATRILLDGLEAVPDDPDMIELIAQLLWQSGERVLAFEYLNKGVEEAPFHVPLLVLIGRYLFDDDQRDAAKLFLARAEAISPRHPVLAQARAYIAQVMSRET